MDEQTKEGVLEYLKKKILEHLANFITFFRLFGTIWVLVIAIRNSEQLWFMVIIAIVVCLSDFLDGKIARHLGHTSSFGAALDQLGDKIFVVPTIIILTWRYGYITADLSVFLLTPIIALIVLLLFIESMLLLSWWIFFLFKKLQIHSSKWAKRKTFAEFLIIAFWLISLILEIELKISVIQYSIYLIGLMLIITDILSYVTLKVYYQEYFQLRIEEKEKNKSSE